jgi:hypothetical protein
VKKESVEGEQLCRERRPNGAERRMKNKEQLNEVAKMARGK